MELIELARAIRARDPARPTWLEALTCYAGVQAVLLHRLAHALYRAGCGAVARMVSHTSRFVTGIEIHPGAKIGRRLFIDHGMGVVIGETAEVGDDVLIYHGVTLGGLCLDARGSRASATRRLRRRGDRRRAQVLGPITVGAGARIGANAVVVAEVPPGASVVGIPARPPGENRVMPRRRRPGFRPATAWASGLATRWARNWRAARRSGKPAGRDGGAAPPERGRAGGGVTGRGGATAWCLASSPACPCPRREFRTFISRTGR
jgi:serine O-acetyltransferase